MPRNSTKKPPLRPRSRPPATRRINARVPGRLADALGKIAGRRGLTLSEAVVQAIEGFVKAPGAEPADGSPFSVFSRLDLIGAVSKGGEALSTSYKDALARELEKKWPR